MRGSASRSWVGPDTEIDGYRLVRLLGAGSIGRVYLAHDALLDRPVAIKFLAEPEPDTLARERFLVEARAIARLQHPNVVAVHRVGDLEMRPYLVSEFVEGLSLSSMQTPLPWRRALEIGLGVARALAAAHAAGVLHRDVKPANILIAKDGTPKLCDFGLAKFLTTPHEHRVSLEASSETARVWDRDAGDTLPVTSSEASAPEDRSGVVLTQKGAVIGTPRYMAPEAWRGESASAATDVYSLGAVLYELCAGVPPHTGETVLAIRQATVSEPARSLRSLVPGIDRRFAAVVERCLLLNPAQRFASALELLSALEGLARRTRFRRVLLWAAPGALMAGYALASFRQTYLMDQRVEGQTEKAATRLGESRAHRHHAEEARVRMGKAFAQGQVAEGESHFSSMRELEDKADEALAFAATDLEAALALDPGRRSTRRSLVQALFDRAELAERRGDPKNARELIDRLQAYDPADSEPLARAWSEPGHLTLTSTPAGLEVTLERYEPEAGKLRPTALERLGTTPLQNRTLKPGSYRATLSLGEHRIRVPFLLRRNQALDLDISLPERIPEGFVHIPAGRFLYGSADDEVARGVFGAEPLQEVDAAAFVIARQEVTLGQWLEFLRVLSPVERQKRMPRALSDAGSIELKELADGGFELIQRSAAQTRSAKEGQFFSYSRRAKAALQDWRRLPVVGINWEDIRAYTGWLDRSGQVPRARLCTELEWERAARGADSRVYPTGYKLAPEDANIDLTYGRDPQSFGSDEVGSHPASNSPFDVADLAGNVWEFTLARAREQELVIRGGSWYQGAMTARSTNREMGQVGMRDALVGFRVCADVVRIETARRQEHGVSP